MFCRRFLAYYIDWIFFGFPVIILSFILSFKMGVAPASTTVIIVFWSFVSVFLIVFIFRDCICKGRSHGKRIMKIKVVDKITGEQPSRKKLVLRNLFFSMFYTIDVIVFLIKKTTLSDILTDTVVISYDEETD